METLIHNKTFWHLLLLTIVGEFLVPFVLAKFYKDYDSKHMVMSVLGNSKVL